MAKVIRFSFEDKEYVLEFTRRTVKEMENEGFVPSELDSRPMTLLPALFAGAFKAHHRWVKQDTIDRIFKAMPNKDSLVEKLAEMYNEPILALVEEPEKAEGNLDWTATW